MTGPPFFNIFTRETKSERIYFRSSLEFLYINTFQLSITKQLQKYTHVNRNILGDAKQE